MAFLPGITPRESLPKRAIHAHQTVVQTQTRQGIKKSTRDTLRVAVTLDDAPVMHIEQFASQWHRKLVIDSLTSALTRYRVPVTVFVIGKQVESAEGIELLRMWETYGAQIGNHTEGHPDIETITPEEFRREILDASRSIRQAIHSGKEPTRYFRFPSLAEGSTVRSRDTHLLLLDSLGLINARATITTDDWRFEERYVQAEDSSDWAARYDIGQEYVEHILAAYEHWVALGKELFQRPVNHVLMLHANRINRDYLGIILKELSGRGVQFITLDDAYTDPLYSLTPTWVMSSGTSFLEFIKQSRVGRD